MHIDSSFSCRPRYLVPFSIFSQFQNFNSFFNCSERDGASLLPVMSARSMCTAMTAVNLPCLKQKNTQGPRLAVKESNMLQHIAKPEIPKSRGPHPMQKMPFVASTAL